jgi:hypothetical protein
MSKVVGIDRLLVTEDENDNEWCSHIYALENGEFEFTDNDTENTIMVGRSWHVCPVCLAKRPTPGMGAKNKTPRQRLTDLGIEWRE